MVWTGGGGDTPTHPIGSACEYLSEIFMVPRCYLNDFCMFYLKTMQQLLLLTTIIVVQVAL